MSDTEYVYAIEANLSHEGSNLYIQVSKAAYDRITANMQAIGISHYTLHFSKDEKRIVLLGLNVRDADNAVNARIL